MRALLLLLLPLTLGSQATPARQTKPMDPAVKRDGWWIRLKPEPRVEVITWQISNREKPSDKPVTFTWTRGNDPDNFDLPESVRLAGTLGLTITAKPAAAAASFCVFYAANGVALVSLPVTATFDLNAKARDKNCTP